MSVYEWSNVLSAFANALAFFLIFEAFLVRRKSFTTVVYIVGWLCLAGAIIVCNHFLLFSFVNILVIMGAALLAAMLYVGEIWKKALSSVCVSLICIMAEILTANILRLIFPLPLEQLILIPSYRMLGVLLSALAELAVCNVIRVRRQHKNDQLGKTYWLLFLLLFFNFCVVAFLMFRLPLSVETATTSAEAVFSSVGLLFSIGVSLYLYERQTAQSAAIQAQKHHELQMESQLKHLDDILAKQNELRSFKHDISNKMTALEGYLEAGDTHGALTFMRTLTHRLETIAPMLDTGNTALDATLSTKKTLAENKGIDFTMTIHVQENLPIAPEDICTIFGNALDNAIEACQRLDENQQKSIDISLVQLDTVLLCKIINTAPEQTGNDLSTSKKDTENHGFGLANLRESLAKYDSVPEIEWQQGKFSLSFVLPVKNKS